MHASKGLEFRAVVLVDLGAAVRPEPLTLAIAPARGADPPRLVLRHSRPEGGPIFTPEAADFRRDVVARETAERRRLTYVAMTRAKERLFLLVPPAAPGGSAAATLRDHLPDGECDVAAVEGAAPYLARERKTSVGAPFVPGPPPRALARNAAGPLQMSTTPLATFDGCPRRYQWLHELELEPPPFGSAASAVAKERREERRALGVAAHRVLEIWPLAQWGKPTDPRLIADRLIQALRPDADVTQVGEVGRMAASIAAFLEGPYARRVREARGIVYREEPFVVAIERPGGVLQLRGTIDLWVAFPDGSAEIVDYKSAWQRDDVDAPFQLRAYALAVHRLHGLSPVRVAVLNLASTEPALSFVALDGDALGAFEDHLGELRAAFLSARSSDHFPGVETSRCQALQCGFMTACHRREPPSDRAPRAD
jgi:ATP-dependent helicase/nuclease subunit A